MNKLLCNLLCLFSGTPILSIFAQKHVQSLLHQSSWVLLAITVLEIHCNFAMAVQFSSNLGYAQKYDKNGIFSLYHYYIPLSRILKFLHVLRFRSTVQLTTSLFCHDATAQCCSTGIWSLPHYLKLHVWYLESHIPLPSWQLLNLFHLEACWGSF